MGEYTHIKKVGRYYYRVKVVVKEEYVGKATEEEYLAQVVRRNRKVSGGRASISDAKPRMTVGAHMKRASEIARKKLAGWKEEDHEADRIAVELVKKEWTRKVESP